VKENAALLSTKEGSPLSFVQRIEGGARSDDWPVPVAWRALFKGQLADALRKAKETKDPGLSARMTVLVGASDGASPDEVDAALRATSTAIEPWLAVALSLRAGRPVERPGDLVPGITSVLVQESVLAALQSASREPKRLDAAMQGLDVRQRAIVSAMGAIVLGARAPAAWRRTARAGLFIFERPYFR
jgi:hypothetical protein